LPLKSRIEASNLAANSPQPVMLTGGNMTAIGFKARADHPDWALGINGQWMHPVDDQSQIRPEVR
jgi:hypothetical protein